MAASWSSLSNAPPPGVLQHPEEATLCEINALMAGSTCPEARTIAQKVIQTLPAISPAAASAVAGSACTAGDAGSAAARRSAASSSSAAASAGAVTAAAFKGHHAKSACSAKSVFLPPKRSPSKASRIKVFLSVASEEGLLNAIQELLNLNHEGGEGEATTGAAAAAASGDNTTASTSLPSRAVIQAAETFLSVYNYLTISLYGSLRPGITMSGEELTEKFSATRDWSSSPVRCLAWHPHTTKIAVAMRDDSVHIHSSPSAAATAHAYQPSPAAAAPLVPLLKYKQQRGITSMAWRPFYASELAVGCSAGVLVWTVDPCSVVARPSAGCVSLLQSAGHAPVSAVRWQPNGELLLSVSALDAGSVILWNTASETKTVLRRINAGNGNHLAEWSPSGRTLFTASTAKVFRLWSTYKWTQQKWRVFSGCVQTACWSADGSTLLYTTNNECQIFCIKFQQQQHYFDLNSGGCNDDDEEEEDFKSSAGAAVPVMDLQKVTFTDEITGREVTTGGLVHSMRWDHTGDRLVVSFVESNLLAVFQTQVSSSNVNISPMGFINGATEDEFPSCFEFAPSHSHRDSGSLLTVAWSSGRVQHLPMLFTPSSPHAHAAAPNTSFVDHVSTTATAATRGFTRQLSTSHLANNSINAQAEFEPRLFSGPAV